MNGAAYAAQSQNNILRPIPVFAGRGVIFDRNGVELAWNAPGTSTSSDSLLTATSSISDLLRSSDEENGLARREYATSSGLAHVLGYVQYPSKDSNGFYYQEDFTGVDGAEKYFNSQLQGTNGSRLIEVDAHGNMVAINERLKVYFAKDGSVVYEEDGVEHPLASNTPVSMNFWGFTPNIFPQLKAKFTAFLEKRGTEEKSECYIPLTVGELVNEGQAKVKVLRTHSSWFGVTYKEDRPHVIESIQQLIAKGEYPEKLWK